MKLTPATKAKEIERSWHHVDVGGKILGRAATQIAQQLMGKSKPYFVKHLDCGDYVVVTNAKAIEVTGHKLEKKVYTTYSGYPGGLRKETLGQRMDRKPEEVIRHAVSGMLPKNKLRDQMLKRLYVYAGGEHPYGEKFKAVSGKE